MNVISKYPAFVIMVIVSSILGAVEGSFLCYMFSGFNPVWLAATLGFGILLTGSLIKVYYYFERTEPYSSNGIKLTPSIQPNRRSPTAAPENNPNNALLDAFKDSKYPIERRINILKTTINILSRDETVTCEDAYRYIHSRDASYQLDEVKDAFELLSQPLLVVKQEKDGEYKLAVSRHELRERLWVLSRIFLEPPREDILPTKPE